MAKKTASLRLQIGKAKYTVRVPCEEGKEHEKLDYLLKWLNKDAFNVYETLKWGMRRQLPQSKTDA